MFFKLFKWVIYFVIFTFVLTIGSVFYVKSYKPGLVGDFNSTKSEAEQFGKTTDQLGCLASAIKRYDDCRDEFDCHMLNSLFLFGCLPASKPNIGFCQDVPNNQNEDATFAWIEKRCRLIERETIFCGQLFGVVIRHCHGV